MRVIAGRARRRELAVCPGRAARPFLGLARGALFNALGDVERAHVLDLYAGSGALGIEALSRGGESCTFVEQEAASVRVIEGNLVRCGLENAAEVVCGSVAEVLGRLGGAFELVFVDPPFALGAQWEACAEGRTVEAETARLLGPEGRLVFRCEERVAAPKTWNGLALVWERCYGRSRISIFAPPARGR